MFIVWNFDSLYKHLFWAKKWSASISSQLVLTFLLKSRLMFLKNCSHKKRECIRFKAHIDNDAISHYLQFLTQNFKTNHSRAIVFIEFVVWFKCLVDKDQKVLYPQCPCSRRKLSNNISQLWFLFIFGYVLK